MAWYENLTKFMFPLFSGYRSYGTPDYSQQAAQRAQRLAEAVRLPIRDYGTATTPSATSGWGDFERRMADRDRELANIRAAYDRLSLGLMPQRTWIPSFDISGAYGRSLQRATEGASNWFNTELNLFNQQQTERKKYKQKEYEMSVEGLEKELKDYLEQGGITRGRTTEDVATKLERIKEDELARQLTEARTYDIGRRGMQQQIASTGLTTSGLGKQQLLEIGTQRREKEQTQAKEITRTKGDIELAKTRTFEDLARGERLKGEETEFGKRRQKLSLEQFMSEMKMESIREKRQLETQRLGRLADLLQSYKAQEWRNYLAQLMSPEQVKEATQTYGGFA